MKYYNYHARAKQLIADGHLVKMEIVDKWNSISLLIHIAILCFKEEIYILKNHFILRKNKRNTKEDRRLFRHGRSFPQEGVLCTDQKRPIGKKSRD